MTARPVVYEHGQLLGLGDNDHPQYPLKASAETITGAWDFQTGVLISSSHPQLIIRGTAPRLNFEDTTPTNGDNWYFQVANNNFRIRNFSNSDGELRLEEKLDLNRQYDPSLVGSNSGIISFDATFDYQSTIQDTYIDISPIVDVNANLNCVVLRGGGTFNFQAGATTSLWAMFRADPVFTTSNNNQIMPSPLFYVSAPTISVEADITNFTGQTNVTLFYDNTQYDVFDGASAVLDILNHYSFRVNPTSVNAGAGLLHIENIYGFKMENSLGDEVDQQYGLHVGGLRSSVASYGVYVGEFTGGSDRKREMFLDGAASIYFREDTSGTTRIYSSATDDLTIESAADVLIDSANLGFYGLTPVVQAAAPVTLADVITVLQNLGLTA